MTAHKNTNHKSNSSRVRKRRQAQKQSSELNFVELESRQLLAAITVSNATDVFSPTADTSSIAALIANAGGDGISLREAITAANNTAGEDAITFDASVFTGGGNNLIRLTQGELSISDSLTIDGSSVGGVVITGDAGGDDVVLAGTSITDVSASEDLGLLNDNSRVLNFSGGSQNVLTSVTVTGGRAESGGGIRVGSFSVSNETLTLNQSTVSGNSSDRSGGGIYASAGVSVSLVGSTVSENSSGVDGGGIFDISGNASLFNSTVSGNEAGRAGGGLYIRNGFSLVSSTVTDNSASTGRGGGISLRASFLDDFTVHNSIVAGNTDPGGAPDFDATSVAGFRTIKVESSLIGNTVGAGVGFWTGSRNILDQAALLGPLADNGGPTLTHALLTGSPAIQGGRNSLVGVGNDTDQRGEVRIVGGTVDIGAVESEFEPSDPLPNDPAVLVVGNNSDIISPTADTSSTGALFTNFGGDGISLREAIAAANNTPGTISITFDASVFTGGSNSLIRLILGELEINDSLIIDGSSATSVVITGDADGDDVLVPGTYLTDALNTRSIFDNSPVLNFSAPSGDLSLTGLTITGGRTNSSGGGIYFNSGGTLTANQITVSGNTSDGRNHDGGGISTFTGNLFLNNSTVSGNSSDESGGGIASGSGDVSLSNSTVAENFGRYEGGGIVTDSGSVSLTNSTVNGNSSSSEVGGGISTRTGNISLSNSTVNGNDSDEAGGGVYTISGDVTLSNSTVSGNRSGTGGGGVFSGAGDVSLSNSTVSDNVTDRFGDGGGIASGSGNVTLYNSTVSGNATGTYGDGGGISSGSGDVTLYNSTVSGNTTGVNADGGGIYSETSAVQIVNSTIVNNSSGGAGGGVSFRDDRFGQSLTLQNSIVANNVDSGVAPDLLLVVDITNDLAVEHSLIGDTSGSGVSAATGTGNILNQSLLLGPLADNGGPTLTHALPSSGLGVDGGSNGFAIAADLNTDQRGEARIESGTVDTGAVEQGDLQNDLLLFVTQLDDENDASDLDINTFDFSDLSLREAITLANGTTGGGTILFEIPGLEGVPQVITIGSQLTISSSVIIEGPGADLLTIDAQGGGDNILDGNGFRIFEVNDGDSNNSNTVSISGLTLTGGDNGNSGGAISNFENLTLNGVSIVDNRADFGGGISNASSGVLILTSSTVANNEASQDGGGISAGGALVFSNVTISGNSAAGNGGGISTGGDIVTTNVTISGNIAAGSGGAIFAAGDISGAALQLTHTTLTNNTGIDGVHFNSISGSTIATFNNTIIDGSVTGVGNNGTTLAGGYNLFADGNPGITGTGNLFNQMPKLRPLTDNGGPTLTHALLSGSPAVNTGSIALSVDENGSPLLTDQRGEDRIQFGLVDIGALETEFEETRSLVVNLSADSDNPFDGLTSLRNAIAFANDPTAGVNGDGDADGDGLVSDTITFDASVFTGGDNNLIRLTLGELSISDGIIIDGSSVGGVVITGDANGDDVTLPGTHITDLAASFGGTAGAADDLLDDNSRVLNFLNASFSTSGNVTLTGLTITGGRVTGVSEGGGGIYFRSFADLTLNQVAVSGNNAANPSSIVGYSLSGGGGILAPNADLYLNGSTVTGNSSGSSGGGIRGGDVHLNNSTVSGNSSGYRGGGIFGDDVSLINSTASGNSSESTGGGIYSGSIVSLMDSSVSDNSAFSRGGGIAVGVGDVLLTNSILSGNSTVGQSDGGGIYVRFGDVSLTDSTVSGNSAGGHGGGIYVERGDVILGDSTVSGNSAGGRSGGIYVDFGDVVLNNSAVSRNSGGGIRSSNVSLNSSAVSGNTNGGISGGTISLYNSTVNGNDNPIDGGGISGNYLSLTNSTVSGNRSGGAGGGIAATQSILLVNSTVTDNSADEAGGGIRLTSSFNTEPLVFHNSIVAGNIDDGTAPDFLVVGDETNDLIVEHSLIGDTTGSGITATTGTGNVLNQQPLLGPLADNGGPTQTHALLPGSPAIDAGDDMLAVDVANAPLATDQRGGALTRSFDDPVASGSGVDIGAFELHAVLVDNPIDEDDGDIAVGDLSLREAIRLANDSPAIDTITFDATVFTGGESSVIRLTQGELVISDSVSINGSLANDVVITGDANDDDATFPGTAITDVLASFGGTDGAADDFLDDNSRVLNFSSEEANLTLTSVTITGGQVSGPNAYGGGVLFSSSGTLILNQTTVSGNGTSGLLGNGGGLFVDSGDVFLNSSTVSENNTRGESGRGGGIYSRFGTITLNDSALISNSTSGTDGKGGGISAASGSVSLINTTISGNSTSGIGSDGGGIYTSNGSISLVNSTISANSTAGYQGLGGGVFSYDGTVSLTSSTVSGNSTTGIDSHGGGIYSNDSTVVVVNSTIASNSSSGVGGGIGLAGDHSADNERLTLYNSIVAGNTDNGTAPDLLAPSDVIDDLIVEHSLIGDTTGSGIVATPGTGNILNQLALLGPLADNGGSTLTHALLPDSPAIDVGNNNLALDENGNPLTTDQRGEIRVVGAVDIGAVETQFDGVVSLVVTTSQDVDDPSDGLTSLREAIAFTNLIFSSAGDSDTITFDASVFTGSDNSLIRLTQGELAVSDSLIIDGSSVVGLVITGDSDADDITLAGTHITDVSASFGGTAGEADDLLDDNSRVINFSSEEGDLTLTGLTLTGGRTTEINRSETTHSGGGIRFESSGTLTLSGIVSGNSTSGGSSHGGGIFSSSGDISLTDSTVSGNSTTGATSHGGGIYSTGDVSLNNSTVSGNGSAQYGGGIFTSSGLVFLSNSTVSENISDDDGGGIRTSSGDVFLTSSTVSGNNAVSGVGGGISTFGNLSITNGTITGNTSSGDGGGIWSDSQSLTLQNSIIAGNTSSGTASDLKAVGSLPIVEYSLIGDTTGSGITFTTGAGNILNQLPLLGPLADNGGPTETHALLPGSRAINTGSNAIAIAAGVTIDQRGEDRIQFGTVDMGAFESDSEERFLVVTTNQDVEDPNDGFTSLREAIALSSEGVTIDTITFESSVFNAKTTIYISSQFPTITGQLTIAAPGANLLTIDAQGGGDGVLDGNGFRIFGVNDGDSNNFNSVFISGLTLTGGDTSDSGGAISNFENLTLDGVEIVSNRGNLGGGISNELFGKLTITNSTIANNKAAQNGGGIYTRGELTAANVTISGNSAVGNGSAIASEGETSGTILSLTHSTITNNIGNGVYFNGTAGSTLATVNNTIIDSPVVGVGNNNTTLSGSNNLFSSADPDITGTGNQFNQASLLGPLADNGGPTLTHALLPGSPAIDAGNNALAVDENGNSLTTDQRGEGRIQAGTVDIGAFESDAPPLLGDANQDGNVNFLDISPFISLISTSTFSDEADINADGNVNFLDISPFIALLSSGGSTDPFLLGDANLDGNVNFLDISPFISLISNSTFLDEADINRDGSVNFLDISPFIALLSLGGSSAATSQFIVASAPVSSLVSVATPDPVAVVTAASTVAVPVTTETLDAKQVYAAPAKSSHSIATTEPLPQASIVLASGSLASPVDQADDLTVVEMVVAGVTPMEIYRSPVAVAPTNNRSVGDRSWSLRDSESNAPLVRPLSLTGKAQRPDFSPESSDTYPTANVSTGESFSTAAELFDAHPESLDEVFDFELESTLSGLI